VSFYGFCTHGSGKTGCAALMAAASFYGAQRNKRYSVQQEMAALKSIIKCQLPFFALIIISNISHISSGFARAN
jgi:hypothetical protein